MSKYTIQELRPRDFRKLDNIKKQPRRKKRQWKQDLRSGNRRIYVCEENKKFIALGGLVYEACDPDYTIPGQRVELVVLIVKEGRRGEGIGTAMVAFLCDEARRQGFREITLGVNKANAVARHVYEKAGFDTLLFDGEDQWGAYLKLMKRL